AKVVYALALVALAVYLINVLKNGAADTSFIDSTKNTFTWFWDHIVTSKSFWTQVAILPLFFLANFVIFFGPMMAMGVSQIRGFEPGDADRVVKFEDVRGQTEAKGESGCGVLLWLSWCAIDVDG